MKIAAGIIGLMLGIVILFQSCAVATTASLASDQAATGAGQVGIIVGFLFFLGGAFAFGLPIVATVIFVLAALFAFAASGEFTDLQIWGYFSLALAIGSFFAWRSARKAKPDSN